MPNTESTPRTIYRKDYRPPDYLIEQVALTIDLQPEATEVTAQLQLVANYQEGGSVPDLWLDGEGLQLLSITLDGEPVAADRYQVTASGLRLQQPPRRFLLETRVRIDPIHNTRCEGLYLSNDTFTTQCEAEGFRQITFYLDRPDVLARFTTRLIADSQRYPVLLANGNRVASGALADGRHFVEWSDPFPKPCYLFAAVAGDLARVSDRFTTQSGRQVTLDFYVQHGNEARCQHAIAALQQAMRWDEQQYGREYDLDSYMVVAIDHFNMGAMENKGLNIFNSKFVLASPDTATDEDYVNIAAVIAHEYFHNWSGNRVTCRDWFQLSLKEGFTVFRDSQFTADHYSAAVKRIDDVQLLRSRQFAEDAGPLAHPIRPDSYVEINNFYTLTIYEKGAEVVRMLHTLLGADRFRRGCDRYFARYDGQAVTCDDFVMAMEEANNIDLQQFRRWYSQAGTPELTVTEQYDADRLCYTLTLRQHCPATPGQPHKEPFLIPVALALFDSRGEPLPLRVAGDPATATRPLERVVAITEREQQITFVDIPEPPIPSLLRNFSAPVKLQLTRTPAQLAFLIAHDNDALNRWDAAQQLALMGLLQQVVSDSGTTTDLDTSLAAFLTATGQMLQDSALDPALTAETLTLPSLDYLAEQQQLMTPLALIAARDAWRQRIGQHHFEALLACYHRCQSDAAYRPDAESIAQRRLQRVALDYLLASGHPEGVVLAQQQVERADSMSQVMAALTLLADHDPLAVATQQQISAFYQRWRGDTLVLDKWFALQAGSRAEGGVARVERLLSHPDFQRNNPNRVRSVVAAFANRAVRSFHQVDGAGYRLLAAEVAQLDGENPQIAARLAQPLVRWQRYAAPHAQLMREALATLAERTVSSPDLYEVVAKGLEG